MDGQDPTLERKNSLNRHETALGNQYLLIATYKFMDSSGLIMEKLNPVKHKDTETPMNTWKIVLNV